jgi:hypothetical protein
MGEKGQKAERAVAGLAECRVTVRDAYKGVNVKCSYDVTHLSACVLVMTLVNKGL